MPHPRLTFHGTARSVTGSGFRLETDHGDTLIDCGLFQSPIQNGMNDFSLLKVGEPSAAEIWLKVDGVVSSTLYIFYHVQIQKMPSLAMNSLASPSGMTQPPRSSTSSHALRCDQ
ncbi:MAG: hypothetical protein CVT86_03635 [Alphaproteobacteria bacterium HGW-Alphaproteobacteria-8]|jgi:predicted metal-dependent RNase|nr:MAG: hypothetical protein CVT86_03635 [Alphaproteobacteria bacterium HGW-Alphaproteobacteria-8]